MSALLNDLRFYGTTINECPDVRGLFKRAAAEIDRLGSLTTAVKCFNCRAEIKRSGDWYRCFDCKAHLCERCVTKHFGEKYAPHHRTMENYKQTIERLRRPPDRGR